MGNIIYLNGASTNLEGEKPDSVKARTRQAVAMLQAGAGLSRVIDGLRAGAPIEFALDDLVEIEAFITGNALS